MLALAVSQRLAKAGHNEIGSRSINAFSIPRGPLILNRCPVVCPIPALHLRPVKVDQHPLAL